MEVIKELVRNVVIIILLTTFLDMLLPSGGMRPFVKVIMGLFVLISMLNPVLGFFQSEKEFEVFAWQQDKAMPGFTTVLSDSGRLNDVNQEMFLENYATRVALQMESMIKLIEGIEKIDVQLVLAGEQQAGSLGSIKSVIVTVKAIKAEEAVDIEQEIKEILTRYFALKLTQISIVLIR